MAHNHHFLPQRWRYFVLYTPPAFVYIFPSNKTRAHTAAQFDFDFDFDFDHIREPDGHIEAFYQYERERKPYATRITKVSSLFFPFNVMET